MKRPGTPSGTLAYSYDTQDTWVSCPDCGNYLFWLEFSHSSAVLVWCRTCKKTWRVLLGIDATAIDEGV